MKTILVLSIYFIVAPADSIFQLKRNLSKRADILNTCLNSHNIDPAVLQLESGKNYDSYDELTDEQKGCIHACFFKTFNLIRADGSLDIDKMTGSDTTKEKKKYQKMVVLCKAEVGDNECKFFECLDKKDI